MQGVIWVYGVVILLVVLLNSVGIAMFGYGRFGLLLASLLRDCLCVSFGLVVFGYCCLLWWLLRLIALGLGCWFIGLDACCLLFCC